MIGYRDEAGDHWPAVVLRESPDDETGRGGRLDLLVHHLGHDERIYNVTPAVDGPGWVSVTVDLLAPPPAVNQAQALVEQTTQPKKAPATRKR